MSLLKRNTLFQRQGEEDQSRTAVRNSSLISRRGKRSKTRIWYLCGIVFASLSLVYIYQSSPSGGPDPYNSNVRSDNADDSSSMKMITNNNMTFDQQTEWIKNNFRSADPSEQEWCIKALTQGNYWKQEDYNGGSQFGGDGFIARNLFWDYVVRSKKGFYVEAGANHYRLLSATFLYDKCFGWEGLCVEPQQRYQNDLVTKRSCKTVRACLTKEKTQMMIGGMPEHRGAGAFIKPIPEDGVIPDRFEKVECAPLQDFLGSRTHVDLFVLDVEGAELPVLDTIDWHTTTFSVLQIETNKVPKRKQSVLKQDMSNRGYEELYSIEADTIYVPANERFNFRNSSEAWQPPGEIVNLLQGD